MFSPWLHIGCYQCEPNVSDKKYDEPNFGVFLKTNTNTFEKDPSGDLASESIRVTLAFCRYLYQHSGIFEEIQNI